MNDNITVQATQELMPFQAKVRLIEDRLKQLPQTFIPIKHYFGHGLYTRVGFIPKDTIITGKQHLKGQHNILLVGSIQFESDSGPFILHAPDIVVSPPGTKRAARALTDVVWATILATDLTDIDEIERQFIHPIDCTAPPRLKEGD